MIGRAPPAKARPSSGQVLLDGGPPRTFADLAPAGLEMVV